jgi:translation initiation factor IF-2
VAINKIDKTGANVERVKQQLSEQKLLVEEWGGDTIALEMSAKTGKGVNELLDMILLVADVDNLRADTDVPARGLIIESHVEQARGPIANGLIEEGILRQGDFVVAGATYAKLRNLESSNGKPLQAASPSTPVVMSGFKVLPEFGEEFSVAKDEKVARSMAEKRSNEGTLTGRTKGMTSNEFLRMIKRDNETNELDVVIKADTQGSLTSVIDSLKTLDNDEVMVRIVGSGIGSITENDLYLAHASNAIVYGFNVTMQSNVKHLASRQKVIVRLFDIIYELIDDVREDLKALLSPTIVKTELGRLLVRAIFKTTKSEVICGGEVTKGKLTLPALATVMRGDDVLAEVEILGLKRGPTEVKEVLEKEMCGVNFKTTHKLELQEGDRLEFFRRESVARSLVI